MFTPIAAQSAIGKVASLTVNALLARGHDVAVVGADSSLPTKELTHDFPVPLLSWQDTAKVERLLANVDLCIYQIGDCLGFHRGCLEWLPKAPGVICLHDFFVGNLFQGWCHASGTPPQSIIRHWYGNEVVELVLKSVASELFYQETHSIAPMTEWVSSLGLGVLTHSSWGVESVLRGCPGPVAVTPLCYEPHLTIQQEHEKSNSDQVFRIATLGSMNPNKRASSVIQAIGQSTRLRDSTEYRLVGAISDSMRQLLVSQARCQRVCLRVDGAVDSDTFCDAIQNTDAICCLRWPALEAGSASLIEAMLHGKATLVTDTGAYAEVADDCVVKISQEREIDEIQAALERLFENAKAREELGARARAYAVQNYAPEKYADSLLQLSDQVLASAPRLKALTALSQTAFSWGATSEMLRHPKLTEPLRILERD
ncbi:glycosyltransferase family 4 protein [Aureliella helgolandensis]|nr:glycosyltransferase [Aureliella helgolandensis]